MNRELLTILIVGVLAGSCGKRLDNNPSEQNRGQSRRRHSRQNDTNRDQQRKAFQAAKAVGPQIERDRAIAKIAWESLTSAPEIAAASIGELSEGSLEREALIASYTRTLAISDPQAALAWATSLGDKSEIEHARTEIAETLRGTDPGLAMSFLPESKSTTEALSSTAVAVLQNWTTKDASEALAWVAERRNDMRRKVALKTVFDQFVQTDPEAALKWLQFQGNRQLRNEAANAIAGVLAEQLPERRLAILEKADASVRDEIKHQLDELVPLEAAALDSGLPDEANHEESTLESK